MKNLNFLSKALCLITMLMICRTAAEAAPGGDGNELRVAVAGVAHGHLNDIISRMDRGDFKVVGVWEKDDRMRRDNGLIRHDSTIPAFDDLGEMLDTTRPEAVVAYGPIYDHMEVVEACAPRGIHVMVEKPLAVNIRHARRMAKLARGHGILLLTNYETSWYSSNHEAYRMVKDGSRNIVSLTEDGSGKTMETVARPIITGNGFTLAEIEILTGRTHQIRVQLAEAGYPLIGDPKYGDSLMNRKAKSRWGLGAQLLHAYRIKFGNPGGVLEYLDGLEIKAGLPEDFKRIAESIFGRDATGI